MRACGILDTTKLSKGWFKSSDNLNSKAHLKYRDTTVRETVANDREKCALKWLFVSLVVETDTLYTDIELVNANLENNAMGSNPERASI